MALIRMVKSIGALAMARMPAAAAKAWFGSSLREFEGRPIDPKAQAVGEMILAARDPDQPLDVETMREGYRAGRLVLDDTGPSLKVLRDVMIDLPHRSVPVRIYDDTDTNTPRPTLVFLHGGGWVIGDLDTHQGICARLAKYSGLRVMAVDYALAPEHKFPAAADEILALHGWLQDHGPSLGVDTHQLAYGGDSAGGNLTGVLMHDLSAAGQPLPKAQLLIYPAVDARMAGDVMEQLSDAYVLPTALARWFRDQYLEAGHDPADPRVSPLFSPYHGAQPPAYIVTGGHDILRPQAELYARRLEDAGVPVTYEELRGQIHGFVNFFKAIPEADDCARRMGAWLKATL